MECFSVILIKLSRALRSSVIDLNRKANNFSWIFLNNLEKKYILRYVNQAKPDLKLETHFFICLLLLKKKL